MKREASHGRAGSAEAKFAEKLPVLVGWIRETLAAHESRAVPVADYGFRRLSEFFSAELLASTAVVESPQIPVPPLAEMGLGEYVLFEQAAPLAITYGGTYFIRSSSAADERVHFHELVHVVQWHVFGEGRFLSTYASELLLQGYQGNRLEVMACRLQQCFSAREGPFDVGARVAAELRAWEG